MIISVISCSKERSKMNEVIPTTPQDESFELEHPPISCKLKVALDQHIINGIFVGYTIFNKSDKDLSVLKWHTPLEGFYSKLFIITNEYNEEIAYQGQGPIVKRGKPTLLDYQLIRAGRYASVKLDVSLVYDLIPGDYKLQLNKTTVQIIENNMPLGIGQCETEIISFSVN